MIRELDRVILTRDLPENNLAARAGTGTCVRRFTTRRPFSASIVKEGRWFVAQCLEVDVASQGRTKKSALANLRAALELHFAYPHKIFTAPPFDCSFPTLR